MCRRVSVALSILTYVCLNLSAFAQAGADPVSLEKLIPRLMREGDVPGLSVALIKDGSVSWHQSFGVRNADTRVPLDDATIFEAASLSKPVFAYAILKLVDQGKLDLDKPLIKYLPERAVPNDERSDLITARMVLDHTTGFQNQVL